MGELLTYTIIGLVLASTYAVIASGLVLTYTTTGIFNFAHGATGMLAAFAYWQLRWEWGWPAPIALAVVILVLAPLLGLGIERLVMRGLHDTSDTVKLVVTIALLSAMIALARWVWSPSEARSVPRLFDAVDPIDLGPTGITVHQLVTIAAAIVVAGGLWAVLHRTRIGIAMRGAVDDRTLSVLNGADPVLSGRVAWALGSSLAAVGGILISSNVSLDAASLSLLIVSCYAAAIFGRLRSLPMTFVGALVVGLTESYLSGYLPQSPYLIGLRLAAPALILLVVLLLIPNPRLKLRTATREDFPLPTWAGAIGFSGAAIGLAVVLATTLSKPDMVTYAKIFPIAIVALSFVTLVGLAGQISLCQMSLAGIGALVASRIGTDGQPWALLLAALVAGVVGAIIALPALRLSGIYLALATAAFAMVLDRWLFNIPAFSVFGLFDVRLFAQDSATVAPLSVFGVTFDTARHQMLLGAVVFAVLALGVVALRRGSFGRRLLAVKDSEAACATLGGGILVTKVTVFFLSSAIAGLGGALYAMQLRTVDATSFDLVSGLPLLVLAVVGGIATVGGALFVGLAFTGLLPALVSVAPALDKLVAVLPGLAGVMLGRNPNGVVSDVREASRPLVSTPVAWITGGALFGVAYLLRVTGAIDSWPFAIVAVASFLVAFAITRVVTARAHRGQPAAADAEVPAAVDDEVALEWVGLRRPWTADDVAAMDAALGLAPGEVGAGAHG